MNSIAAAQSDMRNAYYGGAPGIVTSGTAWLLAGLVALTATPWTGILTLVFGGMFILPVSVVLCRLIGCSGKHSKGNPLAPLAMEGTIWMVLCIPIALAAALYRVEWFFPAMLFVIAGRYLTFSTVYGMRVYWLFGAALIAAAMVVLFFRPPVFIGALAGSVVEYVFGISVFITHKAQQPQRLLNSQAPAAEAARGGSEREPGTP